MSIYAVNRLCHQLLHDKAFRKAMQDHPETAIAPLDLTEEERAALLAGDVGKLYRMGVNAFLLGYLSRFEVLGLTLDVYSERMRAVAE